MPAINYAYDPTGSLVANKVTAENHPVDVTKDRAVFPVSHPFFTVSMAVRGQRKDGVWIDMVRDVDYMVSPMFIYASAATGQEISTYIVLLTDVVKVELGYQALGQYEDKQLLTEVAGSKIDRANAFAWLSIRGEEATYHPMVRDPNVVNRTWLEIFNSGLEKIRLALANPYTSGDNLGSKVTDLEAAISQLISRDEVKKMSQAIDVTRSLSANATVPAIDFELPLNSYKGYFRFVSEVDDIYECFEVHCTAASGTPKLSTSNHLRSDNAPKGLITVSVNRVGSTTTISIATTRAGTLSIKNLCLI